VAPTSIFRPSSIPANDYPEQDGLAATGMVRYYRFLLMWKEVDRSSDQASFFRKASPTITMASRTELVNHCQGARATTSSVESIVKASLNKRQHISYTANSLPPGLAPSIQAATHRPRCFIPGSIGPIRCPSLMGWFGEESRNNSLMRRRACRDGHGAVLQVATSRRFCNGRSY
jgi:hypothetical protein